LIVRDKIAKLLRTEYKKYQNILRLFDEGKIEFNEDGSYTFLAVARKKDWRFVYGSAK